MGVYAFKDNWGKYYLDEIINFIDQFKGQHSLDEIDDIVTMIEQFGDQYGDQYFIDKINELLASDYVIDPALNSESTRPVQNKAIYSELNSLSDDIENLNDRVYYSDQPRPVNTVLAAPSDGSGPAVFRKLAQADIPGLNASKITEGIFPIARIPNMTFAKIPHSFCQARGKTNTTQNISANVISCIHLVSSTPAPLKAGSDIAVANDGIKILTAGVYRITASAYIEQGNTSLRSCFIYRIPNNGAFSNSNTYEICATHIETSRSGAINCGPVLVSCQKNDMIYLAARASAASSKVDRDNPATYLLVERVS